MIRDLLILCCVLTACSTQEIGTVILPEGGCESDCGEADMSCLQRLAVTVYDGDVSQEFLGPSAWACVEVELREDRTVCHLDLGELTRLPVQSGTASVVLSGSEAGPENGCEAPPLFLGGAVISSEQPTARITARCLLSCEERAVRSIEFAVLPFAGGEPPSVDQLDAGLGQLYDPRALMFPSAARGDTEYVDLPVDLQWLDGPDLWVRLSGTVPETVPPQGVCLAARISAVAQDGVHSLACIDGESEAAVGWVSPEVDRKIRDLLEAEGEVRDTGYVVGRVVDAADRPLASATLGGVPNGIGLLYNLDTDFNPTASYPSATTDSGLFVLVGSFVGSISIEAPGFSEKIVRVGSAEGHASALVVEFEP